MPNDKSQTIDGWRILTRRYGQDVRNPTKEQLRDAVQELYKERQDDLEHASVSLRLGTPDQCMYVIDAHLDRSVTFSKYSDQDFESLANEASCVLREEDLLPVLKALSCGDLAFIRNRFPTSGW